MSDTFPGRWRNNIAIAVKIPAIVFIAAAMATLIATLSGEAGDMANPA